MHHFKVAVVALIAALAIPTAASANFAATGPVDPASIPFPTWYEDSTGLQVGLCIEDPGCPASPALADFTAPDGEAFYQLANSTVTGAGGKEVVVDFNVEAAFLDTTPITFGRIQFTAHGLQPNATYTVTHPYGVSHFTVGPNGDLVGGARAAQREETDGSFAGTLGSAIGPFLRSTNAPAGYLGNGVTPATVTGGPLRNTMTVSGPGLPEAITDELGRIVQPAGLTTDKFVVEGRLFDPTAPLPPAPVPVPPDADGDGIPDQVDLCVNQRGDAAHNGCPPPVVVEKPVEVPVIVDRPVVHTIERTVVQQVLVPAADPHGAANAASTRAITRLSTHRRVKLGSVRRGGLRVSVGQLNAQTLRFSVKRGGRTVASVTRSATSRSMTLRLDSRAFRRLGRGRYVLDVAAADGNRTASGSTARVSFRVV